MTTPQKRNGSFCNLLKLFFSFGLLVMMQNILQAQVKSATAPANKSIVTPKAIPVIPPPTAAAKQKKNTFNENIKRLNTTSATSLKNDFTALRQGDYSIISLKLPGSNKVSDYYVKKSGYKLILNGDITVSDIRNLSTKSYTKDDETHLFGKDDLYRWTNGTVPVVLDNSVFAGDSYNIIKTALDYFNFNTGIIFKERTGEEYYLVIK